MFNTRLIGILRTNSGTPVENVVKTFSLAHASGVRAMEITANSENWQEIVSQCKNTDMNVGVGSIKDADTALEAIKLGAKFLVSPGAFEDVIKISMEHLVPVLPGIFLESELATVKDLGVKEVKFFPANISSDKDLYDSIQQPFRDEFNELIQIGHSIDFDSSSLKGDIVVITSPTAFYYEYLNLKENKSPKHMVIKLPFGLKGFNKMKEVLTLTNLWNIKIYAVGGIKSENYTEVINKYGAYGFCVGSALFDANAIKSGDFEKIKSDIEINSNIMKNLILSGVMS